MDGFTYPYSWAMVRLLCVFRRKLILISNRWLTHIFHVTSLLLYPIPVKQPPTILGKYIMWYQLPNQNNVNQIVCIFHGIYCNTTQGWFYRFALSQWEVALLCNNVSHWLGASLEPAQQNYCWNNVRADDIPVHSISWFIELQSALCDNCHMLLPYQIKWKPTWAVRLIRKGVIMDRMLIETGVHCTIFCLPPGRIRN